VRGLIRELCGIERDRAVAFPHAPSPEHVAGAVLRHAEEPRTGIRRESLAPRLERCEQCLLGDVLGRREVRDAEEAGQIRDEPP
jgi:hypothetical protein